MMNNHQQEVATLMVDFIKDLSEMLNEGKSKQGDIQKAKEFIGKLGKQLMLAPKMKSKEMDGFVSDLLENIGSIISGYQIEIAKMEAMNNG